MSTATTPSYDITTIKKGLQTDYAEPIGDRLPAGVDRDKWTSAVVALLETNGKFLTCKRESILKAVYDAAVTGLPPGQGLFYFVPRGQELTFQIGYKGLITIAKASGQVVDIYARLVFEGDEFQWFQGGLERIEHTPALDADRENRPITHIYAVALLTGGQVLYECWSKQHLDQHEKNHTSGGWDSKDWQAMAKKTLVRQFFNSGRLQQLSIHEQAE